MKKYHFISILIMTSILGESCKKYDEADNYLKGIIDGQPFESSSVTANKKEPIPGSGDDPNLRIIAEWPGHSLKLMLLSEGSVKKGVYNIQPDKMRRVNLVVNNTENYYAGDGGIFGFGQLYGNGVITISEISKRYVKGTFDVTVVDNTRGTSKTITNGEFSIARN
ncbi:MAG: DUF6252 family protein [Flavisolibacter sp.]